MKSPFSNTKLNELYYRIPIHLISDNISRKNNFNYHCNFRFSNTLAKATRSLRFAMKFVFPLNSIDHCQLHFGAVVIAMWIRVERVVHLNTPPFIIRIIWLGCNNTYNAT